MEKWRVVKEFKMYQVSSLGRIKSFNKKGHKTKGIILSPYLNKKRGYYYISLENGDKRKNYILHRLVAMAFVPNPNNKPQVNHIDGNKLNNHFSNLEWVTAKENQQHARKLGLVTYKYGEDSASSKLTTVQVREIRSLIPYKQQKDIAQMFGVGCSTIAHIKRGSRWGNVS